MILLRESGIWNGFYRWLFTRATVKVVFFFEWLFIEGYFFQWKNLGVDCCLLRRQASALVHERPTHCIVYASCLFAFLSLWLYNQMFLFAAFYYLVNVWSQRKTSNKHRTYCDDESPRVTCPIGIWTNYLCRAIFSCFTQLFSSVYFTAEQRENKKINILAPTTRHQITTIAKWIWWGLYLRRAKAHEIIPCHGRRYKSGAGINHIKNKTTLFAPFNCRRGEAKQAVVINVDGRTYIQKLPIGMDDIQKVD